MRDLASHAARTSPETDAEITSIDSPARRTAFRALMVVIAIEPLVVFGVLLAIGMPWVLIVALFAGLIVITTLIFWLLVLVLWKPLARRYPPQPFRPGAVSKSWQSFAFGPLMRLNNCLTIVADESHLHLRPFTIMRWLGAGWVSLPLDRMTDVTPGTGILGREMTADLDGRVISGPAWCLGLAAGMPAVPPADNP